MATVTASRGAGNDGPVSTARASSFLNSPGVRCGTGVVVSVAGTGCRCSRAAGQSRRAGIARPARRPRPAPAAGLRKRAAAVGCRRPGTPGPARPAAGGVRPARVGQHRGCVQVLDPPDPGEFVHVGGDAVDDRGHPREVDGHDSPVRPVGGRAQVDRGRADVAAAEFGVLPGVWILGQARQFSQLPGNRG